VPDTIYDRISKKYFAHPVSEIKWGGLKNLPENGSLGRIVRKISIQMDLERPPSAPFEKIDFPASLPIGNLVGS
jgi:hypothetical protein